jgi:predicted DsbA family dithiol-disulfide isomerase
VSERIRFHFDPICPWSYQTSRLVHRLEALGVVDAEWAVFSLEIVNAGSEESVAKGHGRSGSALRTAVAVHEARGPKAVGRFYATLGARVHERHEPLDALDTIRGALREADLDPRLVDEAIADERTWAAVQQQHAEVVEATRSFGVPTIVLDGGQGPAIFGPVISEVPTDEDAVELWHHVAWLTRYENFSELKRERTVPLGLPPKPSPTAG